MRARLLVPLAALALLGATREGESSKAVDEARSFWAEGKLEEAASAYRYALTVGDDGLASQVELALTLRDAGRPEEAAPHWLKATLMAPQDPFLLCQRGWNYLALARRDEAKDSFRKAIEVSSSSIFAAEAWLGVGLAESLDGNPKASVAPLQSALARSAYLRPAAAAELGRAAERLRSHPQAVQFLTMSLSQDPVQPDTARQLGRHYEKTSQPQAAWQAYKISLDMDPSDPHALERYAKLPRFLRGRPTDSMPLRRLARPLMREPRAEPASAPLRVSLYSDPAGEPKQLARFFFMASSDYRLADVRLGEVDRAKSSLQMEVAYRPENRVIEVRDITGNVRYVTKQGFRIEPVQSGATVLVKSAEFLDVTGIDPGDREFRGVLEVVPTPSGFTLLNEVGIDEYLFSAVGQALPDRSPLEAYKAFSTLVRSLVLAMLGKGAPANPERAGLCDSSHCLVYPGLINETASASAGVRASRGAVLELPADARFEHHSSCGWSTTSGAKDSTGPAPRSPMDWELLTHSYPDPQGYDEASARVPAAWNRWLRVLDAAEIQRRADRLAPVGELRHARVLRRDRSGRALALELVGSRGTRTLEGEKAILDVLSPGGLRSTLFTLQALYKGKRLERLMVWGAGTGHGRGLCAAGAAGQAHLGRGWRQILAHYFPGSSLRGGPPDPPAKPTPGAGPAAPTRRRAFPRRAIRRGAQ